MQGAPGVCLAGAYPFFPLFFRDSVGVGGGGEGECFLFRALADAFLSLLSGLLTGWKVNGDEQQPALLTPQFLRALAPKRIVTKTVTNTRAQSKCRAHPQHPGHQQSRGFPPSGAASPMGTPALAPGLHFAPEQTTRAHLENGPAHNRGFPVGKTCPAISRKI